MVEIVLLDKEAVKSLYCAFCLKNKAQTISSTAWTGNELLCLECLKWCTNIETWMESGYYNKKFPDKLGANLTFKEVLTIRRKK